MTKQEEIREGVEKLVSKAYWYEGKKNVVVSITKEIISYLADNNCVLKVDRELPETLIDELEYGDATCADFRWGVSACQKDMLDNNWRCVESLIKEEKADG